jgi:hypothetical protein
MMRYLLERLAPSKEIPRRKQNECTSRMSRIGLVIALCLTQSALAAPQNVPGAAPLGVDAQKCAALIHGRPRPGEFVSRARRIHRGPPIPEGELPLPSAAPAGAFAPGGIVNAARVSASC